MKLIILGNVKSKKNNKVISYNRRTNKPFVRTATETNDYIVDAVRQLKDQFKGLVVTGYPITVKMVFYYKYKHRKDIDNSTTTVLDCMKEAGVIADDDVSHVNKIISTFGGYDKNNPRVEVTLEE